MLRPHAITEGQAVPILLKQKKGLPDNISQPFKLILLKCLFQKLARHAR